MPGRWAGRPSPCGNALKATGVIFACWESARRRGMVELPVRQAGQLGPGRKGRPALPLRHLPACPGGCAQGAVRCDPRSHPAPCTGPHLTWDACSASAEAQRGTQQRRSAARTVRLAWQERSGPRRSPKGMIQSTHTLAQGIDKAPKDPYTPAIWLRCPNKSRMWERST